MGGIMKVYLICGKARHGKDSLANDMKDYYETMGKKVTILQLSAPLKMLIHNHFGWDEQEETKPRELMQRLGTDIIRKQLNKPKYFINRTIEDIEILSCFFEVIIVSDVRFPEEILEIRKAYPSTKAIHITRPALESELTKTEQKHITETALDTYHDYDYEVINTTLEQLVDEAKTIIRKEEVNDEKNDK